MDRGNPWWLRVELSPWRLSRGSGNACWRFHGLGRSRRAASPADTAIEVILDNHSAHVSKETAAWLAAQPVGRFTFTFTPKHGSWLNIIEGFFSKLARSVLRHIRVSSKHELKERLMAFINDINHQPIVHTWHYKIGDAA